MSESQPSTENTAQALQATFIEERVPRPQRSALYTGIQHGDDLPREYQNAYNNWRETMQPESAEKVAAKIQLLGRYALFEPAVEALLGDLQAGAPVPHLGSGGKSHVYQMEIGGQNYAVRLVAPPPQMETPASQVNRYATNMYKALGRPGIEQLQAIYFKKPVTVSFAEAGEASNIALTGETLHKVMPDQVGLHVENLIWLHNGKMTTDMNNANVLYDEHAGFTSIDLGTPQFRDLEKSVGYSLAFLFGQIDPGTPAEDCDARVHILASLRGSLGNHFTRQQAVVIDGILANAQASLVATAVKIRRGDNEPTDSHYYAIARAEADKRFFGRRPITEWLNQYAPKPARVSTPAATAAPQPEPANKDGGGLMQQVHMQLSSARQILHDAPPQLSTTALERALAYLETVAKSASDVHIQTAIQFVKTAEEQTRLAQGSLDAGDASLHTYIQDTNGST